MIVLDVQGVEHGEVTEHVILDSRDEVVFQFEHVQFVEAWARGGRRGGAHEGTSWERKR